MEHASSLLDSWLMEVSEMGVEEGESESFEGLDDTDL